LNDLTRLNFSRGKSNTCHFLASMPQFRIIKTKTDQNFHAVDPVAASRINAMFCSRSGC
jgi:hypothetical protein